MTATLSPARGPEAATRPTAPGRARRSATPWVLLTPTAIILLVLVAVPIVALVAASFTDCNRRSLFTGQYALIGTDQYTALFASEGFWWSLVRTVVFTAVLVAGSVAIGLGFTVLMTRLGGSLRIVVSFALISAWAMPTVASSVVWNWLFQPGYGVANWLLTKLRIFGDLTNTDWSNSPTLAFVSIWLLIVWQAVPFIALTLYAAATQVPPERQEAAQIDRASAWRVWTAVMIPAMRPTLRLVTILSVIWDYNVFNQIWLVSAGGPGDSTSTLGVYAFKTAFIGFDIGRGAALSVVTTVLLLALTAIYIRGLSRSGDDL